MAIQTVVVTHASQPPLRFWACDKERRMFLELIAGLVLVVAMDIFWWLKR